MRYDKQILLETVQLKNFKIFEIKKIDKNQILSIPKVNYE